MADPTPGRDGAAWFTDQISRLQGQIDELRVPSGTQQFNAVPKLQEQIDALAETVAAIPVAVVGRGTGAGAGFVPTDSWQTIADFTLARPAGKAAARVMATGQARAKWSSSGGFPQLAGRVVIGGDVGMEFLLSGAVTGGGTVEGTPSGTFMHTADASGDVQVQVQVRIASWLGSPSSVSWSEQRAQVVAQGIFTP